MDLITEQTNKFYAQELKKAVLSGWSQCGYSEDWLIANKDRLGYREQDEDRSFMFFLDGNAVFQITPISELQGNMYTVTFDCYFFNK